ncbi:hypothetical protein jhhlp_001364 [Lomentospora prolificans]|uniref:Uncharacterized protein n=1 Tax=Lomentospora prolificans TaxID=41688 RepID=A0A2N3NI25_9PEZI|nr:hypothetical protein jhhlp_001364 [Lomentospora prolificans]
MATDEELSNPEVTVPEQSVDETSSSQDMPWEPSEEDDDYEDEDVTDNNDDEDEELMIDPDDMTEQLLQDFIGGGLFANINAIIEDLEEYGSGEELDHGIEPLISDDVELIMVSTDPYGHDDEPDSILTSQRRLAILVEREHGNPRVLLSREQIQYLLRREDILEHLKHSNQHVSRHEFERWVASHRPDPNRFPKVPSKVGRRLMDSGTFGTNQLPGETPRRIAPSLRILGRELGLARNLAERKKAERLLLQSMLPKDKTDVTIYFREPVYSGQFSRDGNFYFACGADFRVRLYDTSNPYSWKHYKTVSHPWAQWTLTDASLSPDNKWLAYTSLSPSVCLAPTDPNDKGDPYTLDLSASVGTAGGATSDEPRLRFGIFSVRFSGDGRELVTGTNYRSIIVYDIETRTPLHKVKGHDADVNAVCFADISSPHILYSGSDDSVIKVWDRRSMGDRREAGAFVGHIEGITHIDSKGDGRYILSNGKDQSMKLWDLRMAISTDRFRSIGLRRIPTFDYRWEKFREVDWFEDKNDNSAVTFRGHDVLQTLIRCHFSPPSSSDSRYVYSGSASGQIFIWNMDATLAGKIDVETSIMHSLANAGRFPQLRMTDLLYSPWNMVVRDASWHPNVPAIATSAWSTGGMREGAISLHTFQEPRDPTPTKDDLGCPNVGACVTEKLQPCRFSVTGRDA